LVTLVRRVLRGLSSATDTIAPMPIDGVELRRLDPFVDHRGTLTEVYDPSDPFWAEPVVWAYLITVRPGRIKGWGMHRRQADRYLLAGGRLRVALHDGREGSPTFGHSESLFFTEESRALLRIPPGVWHADQNWGANDAVIVNFPTVAYDHGAPDKERIDPHSGRIPFDWSLPDG
jgi:dTDP-4-dehydrorhamnose 3,5-epimerase